MKSQEYGQYCVVFSHRIVQDCRLELRIRPGCMSCQCRIDHRIILLERCSLGQGFFQTIGATHFPISMSHCLIIPWNAVYVNFTQSFKLFDDICNFLSFLSFDLLILFCSTHRFGYNEERHNTGLPFCTLIMDGNFLVSSGNLDFCHPLARSEFHATAALSGTYSGFGINTPSSSTYSTTTYLHISLPSPTFLGTSPLEYYHHVVYPILSLHSHSFDTVEITTMQAKEDLPILSAFCNSFAVE
ncbi:hypothetical protein C8Q75DRAFT_576732 [Abortiporus biennis]|nr:hypothetical protein C8Q75DRAFT_576732 [Abortiporus biennis]